MHVCGWTQVEGDEQVPAAHLSSGTALFGSEDAKISAGTQEPDGLLSLEYSCNLQCPG